jgi:hypothetical protein
MSPKVHDAEEDFMKRPLFAAALAALPRRPADAYFTD